jgi:hypothetical protein
MYWIRCCSSLSLTMYTWSTIAVAHLCASPLGPGPVEHIGMTGPFETAETTAVFFDIRSTYQ